VVQSLPTEQAGTGGFITTITILFCSFFLSPFSENSPLRLGEGAGGEEVCNLF